MYNVSVIKNNRRNTEQSRRTQIGNQLFLTKTKTEVLDRIRLGLGYIGSVGVMLGLS